MLLLKTRSLRNVGVKLSNFLPHPMETIDLLQFICKYVHISSSKTVGTRLGSAGARLESLFSEVVKDAREIRGIRDAEGDIRSIILQLAPGVEPSSIPKLFNSLAC